MRSADKLVEIAEYIQNLNYRGVNLDLMGGKSGVALFLAYYGTYAKDQEILNKSLKVLESCIDDINEGFNYPTFAGGLAGFGWLIEHLVKNDLLDADVSDILEPIDSYLIDWQNKMLDENKYDYLHNGLGVTLYLLTKQNVPLDKLDIVPELLKKHAALEQNGQMKWQTSFGKDNILRCNFGLSHGNPSILSILCKLYNKGIKQDLCEEMIKGIVKLLLNNKLPGGSNAMFPNLIPIGKPIIDSRLAWCYGDLGVALSLYKAGKTLNNKEIIREATDTFTHSAQRRDLKKNRVMDAGLCHGSAGIAHIFYRMYKETGIECFNETHEYWLQKTVELAIYEDGPAGYKKYTQEGYQSSYGLTRNHQHTSTIFFLTFSQS